MGWNINLPPAEFYQPGDEKLDGLVRQVRDLKELSCDTETDGLTLHKCMPYYWSLSFVERHSTRERRITLPASTIPYFKDSFGDPYKNWIFANAKFDCHMMANVGITFNGNLLDVAVMHALLFEEQKHDLKSMAKNLLRWGWTDFGSTFGKIRSGYCICGGTKAAHNTGLCKKTGCTNYTQITPLYVLKRCEEQNIGLLVDYAANDAYGTLKLKHKLYDMLANAETWSVFEKKWPYIVTMQDYYEKTEVPFTKVLFRCERNGLRVDRAYLLDVAPKIEAELEQIQYKINALVGQVFNPSSNPQKVDYFVNRWGIKPLKKTKGGVKGAPQPSMDEKFLEHVAETATDSEPREVASLMIEFSKISKQYGTYIKKMPGRLDAHNRVHMRLNQDVARTGRLSSSDPNMQNVTSGEKDMYRLRNAFIPEPGYDMIVADYEQLEMRLLAAASQEPKMMDIFHNNWDIHTGNVSLMYGVPYEEIEKARKIEKQVKSGQLPDSAMTKEVWHLLTLRSHIKTLGFGLNYGMKAKALARRMGCTVEEAEDKIEQYMETYPAVREFFASAVDEVRQTKFAFTLMGRRRYLPDIENWDDYTRFRAERQASNMPIQGTAAEVCKMAMISIDEDDYLRRSLGYRMCLQVHDEIVGEAPKESTETAMEYLKEWMEHPFDHDLGIPLAASIGSGSSWGAAK